MKSKILQLSILFSVLFICNLTYGQTSQDYKLTTVKGFNKSAEPEIKLFTDGHIELILNVDGLLGDSDEKFKTEYWNTFEKELSKELNIVLTKKDKQVFAISNATEETAKKIKKYLETYWK